MRCHHYYLLEQRCHAVTYLGKCTGDYKLANSQGKIYHLMYMDDMKLFAEKEKEMETLIQTKRIYNQNIGTEFSMEKCAMLIMRNGKDK